jgi:hypothetical protein
MGVILDFGNAYRAGAGIMTVLRHRGLPAAADGPAWR